MSINLHGRPPPTIASNRKKRLICCSSSPSNWTKVIAIFDMIIRTTLIIIDACSLASFMIHGKTYYDEPWTNLRYFFAPDPSGRFSFYHASEQVYEYTAGIMRHSLGLVVACVLLIGAIKKIRRFLHLWCAFAIFDTVVSWLFSFVQIRFAFKALQTLIVLLCGAIVLTLVGQIDVEKRRRPGQLCEDDSMGPVTLISMRPIHTPPPSPPPYDRAEGHYRGNVSGHHHGENYGQMPPPYKEFEPPSYEETVQITTGAAPKNEETIKTIV